MASLRKPNILVIMGDDVGMWNISTYLRGMMGGWTPNIDRIAAEGALFTDYYAQQSCTAARAAFLQTFKEHPRGQVSGSYSVERALRMLEAGAAGGGKLWIAMTSAQ
jgi:hypothetical protein